MAQHSYQFADIDGTKMHYEVRGDGMPLVLLHAGICDLRMWDAQMDTLAQRYQVVRYDRRGFGQTAPVAGTSMRHEELRVLLDHLGIEQAHLLGCSQGGTTAFDFVLAYPDRVASLITVCSAPSGHNPDVEPPPLWADIIAADEAGDTERLCELEVQLWVDGLQRAPGRVDAEIRQLVYAMNLLAIRNDDLDLGAVVPLEPRAVGRLGEIHAPTLAIVGALDMPDTANVANTMVEQMANARKVVIDDAAHLPNMEQPAEFNRLVLDFLKEIR